MFGFLNPGRQDIRYRSVYARCCEFQHLLYGAPTLPFHSYEATFLYLCALDAGVLAEANIPRRQCCHLRMSRSTLQAADAAIGTFTASLSMLLASIKVDDDITDHGSLRARVQRLLFGTRFRKAEEYFQERDRGFRNSLADILLRQRQLESSSCHSLELYAEPTADAFFYVFGLLGQIPGMTSVASTLRSVGGHIGKAMIAVDCAKDWRADKRTGGFNPVSDADQAKRAIAFAIDQLQVAVCRCSDAFGVQSRTAQALAGVRDRVQATKIGKWQFQPAADVCGETGDPRDRSVVLNAVCCVPCQGGGLAVGSDDCVSCATTCCCCMCCCSFCANHGCGGH